MTRCLSLATAHRTGAARDGSTAEEASESGRLATGLGASARTSQVAPNARDLVWNPVRHDVHEVLRPRVHDVARFHTSSLDSRYQEALRANCSRSVDIPVIEDASGNLHQCR